MEYRLQEGIGAAANAEKRVGHLYFVRSSAALDTLRGEGCTIMQPRKA